jgi:hypothetical protein
MQTNTSHICPSCGIQGFDSSRQCTCGYNADESIFTNPLHGDLNEYGSGKINNKGLEKIMGTKNEMTSQNHVIKEIDSWFFNYSQDDNCICLSTPALKSFTLKLTIEDLEELMEFMYQQSGREKTTRRLQLSTAEIPDLIEKVHKMIEEKRSKMPVKFSDDEFEEIVDLINLKLKD